MADDTEDETEAPVEAQPEEDTEVAKEEPGYQLVNNAEDHYEVKHLDGSKFKVVKDLVDGATKKKIEGFPPASQDVGAPGPVQTASGLENGFSPEDLAKVDALAQKGIDNYTPDIYDPVTGKTSKGQPNPAVVQSIRESALREVMGAKQTLADTSGKMSEMDKSHAQGVMDRAQQGLQPQPPQEAPAIQSTPAGPMQNAVATQGPTGQTQASFAPVSDQGPSVPQGTPQVGPNDYFGQMQQDITKAGQAAEQYGKAQETLAGQTAKAYQDQENNLAAIQKEYDKKREVNYQRMDGVRQDVLDGKIDPNRFWNSKSVPNKIGSAIAIVLGGLGGGLSRTGGNAALDVINKEIDRDVEAQKANLNQKDNALRLLIEQGHSINEAENIQRSNMLAATAAQVQKYTAQAQSPQAKLASSQLMMQIHGQAMNLAMQGAQYQLHALAGAGVPLRINPQMIQDEKLRERAVAMPDGSYRFANTKEDVQPIRETMEVVKPIYDDLDQLDKISKSALYGNLSPELRHRAEGIRGRLAINLNKANGFKRFNEGAADELTKSLSSGWSQILTGGPQTTQMKDALMNQTQSMLQQRLMNYQPPPKIPSAKPARGE